MDRPRGLRFPWLSIPVAIWAGSLALDMASIWLGNVAVREAFYCVTIGLAVALLIAAGAGLNYNRAPAGNKVLRITLLHAFVFTSALLVFALNAWARGAWLDATVTPTPAVLLTALGLMFMAFASFLSRQVTVDERGVVVRVPQEAPPRRPR